MLVYDCQRNTLRLSDVSVWRCGSFSVHGVLSSGLMCEGPVSAGKRRTARTQDLVSTCLCRASAWAFRLRNSTWTKSVRVFLISNWGENLKRTFSICYNYFLHLRKWNLWELVRIQSWCSWWRPETSCFIWQKKFFVVFFTCWCQRTSWQHLRWSRAHLALVFSSEGFNEIFDTERFPHEDGDSLEDNEICWKTKNPQRSEHILESDWRRLTLPVRGM